MSALPSKADIGPASRHVRFVPKADQVHCSKLAICSSCPARGLRKNSRPVAVINILANFFLIFYVQPRRGGQKENFRCSRS
jgi:hypothetical protein